MTDKAPTLDEQISHQKIYAESTAQWLACNPESKNAKKECATDAAILASLERLKLIEQAERPEPVAWAVCDYLNPNEISGLEINKPEVIIGHLKPLYDSALLAFANRMRVERDELKPFAEAYKRVFALQTGDVQRLCDAERQLAELRQKHERLVKMIEQPNFDYNEVIAYAKGMGLETEFPL